MKINYFFSLPIILFILLGITGCSLEPGSYNEAIRFSENSSSDFDTKWSDQLLSDQTVGYETGTSHPYYVLFYTTDFKDYTMQNMIAKVGVSINGAADINLANVSLTRLASGTEWVGTFYLPSTYDDTPQTDVTFHLQDAQGEYEECSGFFVKTCSWTSVSLSDYGFDATSYDTYSDPFDIKEAVIDSSGCVAGNTVLFLEDGKVPADNDCTLKTKLVDFTDDFDLYIDNTVTGTTDFTTEYNVSSNGNYLAGPFSVDLVDSGITGWSVAQNILTRIDAAETAVIEAIRSKAYEHITFTLSDGASFEVVTPGSTVTEGQCCAPKEVTAEVPLYYSADSSGNQGNCDAYTDADGFGQCGTETTVVGEEMDTTECTNWSETITSCPLNPNQDAATRTLIESVGHDMSCSKPCCSSNYTCEISGGSGASGGSDISSDEWDYLNTRTVSSGATTTSTVTADVGLAISDPFAIRPHHYKLYYQDANGNEIVAPSNLDLVAGYDFNVTIKAQNSANELVENYTTTLSSSNFSTTVDAVSGYTSCIAPEVNVYNTEFTNGLGTIRDLTFTNIADVAMNPTMYVDDVSWTSVDQDGDCIADSSSNTAVNGKVGCNIGLDTPYAINKIDPATFTFIPMFGSQLMPDGSVFPTFIRDSRQKSFTYLDDTLTQSLDINFTLQAISAKGAKLKNYDANCIAQDVALHVNFTHGQDMGVVYEYAQRSSDGSWPTATHNELNSSATSIDINLLKQNFNRGELSIGGGINFKRDRTRAVNPFYLAFTSASVSDALGVSAEYPVPEPNPFQYLFYYAGAQAYVQNVTLLDALVANKKSVVVDYNVYCDRSCNKSFLLDGMVRHPKTLWWYKNPEHQVYDGALHIPASFMYGGVESVNGVTTENTETEKNKLTSSFSHENNTTVINVVYDQSSGYPFQKYIDYNVSSWLQYNRFSDDVNSSISERLNIKFTKDMTDSVVNSDTLGNTKASEASNRRIHW